MGIGVGLVETNENSTISELSYPLRYTISNVAGILWGDATSRNTLLQGLDALRISLLNGNLPSSSFDIEPSLSGNKGTVSIPQLMVRALLPFTSPELSEQDKWLQALDLVREIGSRIKGREDIESAPFPSEEAALVVAK